MSPPRLVRLDPFESPSAPMIRPAIDGPHAGLSAGVLASDARRPSPRAALNAILVGGLAAGVLDIAAALIQSSLRGGTPTRLFQAIASGLLGRASYDGGMATVALGVVSHFAIAMLFAAAFVLIARRVPFLTSIVWLSGPVYGMIAWATMRFVVLPLSAYPHAQGTDPAAMVRMVLIHIFCVGLPIAVAARWFLGEQRRR